MIIDQNTIKLVRALVKISSAIDNMDEISHANEFKFSIKKDLPPYQQWLEVFIKQPMDALANADSDTLMELIKIFDEYAGNVYIKNNYCTHINLMLAKLKSALYDLEALDESYREKVSELISKTYNFSSKGYFKIHINYVDPEGNTFESLIQYMNKAGDHIIIGTQ